MSVEISNIDDTLIISHIKFPLSFCKDDQSHQKEINLVNDNEKIVLPELLCQELVVYRKEVMKIFYITRLADIHH